MSQYDPRLILLDPRDNVFVARTRLPAGEPIETGTGPAVIDRDIALAHKIARRAIAPGEKIDVVVRYVQDLSYDGGQYEFVFPMVVGPRYMPGRALAGPSSGAR